MHRLSNGRALAATALLLVPAAACGDDDEPAASGAFCDAVAAFADAVSTGGDPSGPIDDLVADAPDDLAEDVAGFVDAVTSAAASAASSGDDRAFLEDDFRSLAADVQRRIGGACDYQAVPIEVREYAFGDLPETIDSGLVAFELTNVGEELHELILLRRAEGTVGDLVDVVNDDPGGELGQLEEVGVALPVAAGDDSVLLADLDPGDYVVVCFFPVGVATFDELLAGAETVDDHRSLGMIQAVTVG